jgi:16S rRNA (adenine1518-N6/adenine1519-N6)-dimethyltransferase
MMRVSRRKALGQHFLKDRGSLQKIVKIIAPVPEDTIIEIGAGKGILTFALAKSDCQVIAIEKDPAFINDLRKPDFPNLTVLEADVLKTDLVELAPGREAKIVGNLPYSISSPVLFQVLSAKDSFSLCVFLLQKEVAERLCASPGTKKYAPLSILFENHFERKLRFIVSPESFSPPPKVESALVSLEKRVKPLFSFIEEKRFQAFLKTCFRHRRKTLVNNLKFLTLEEKTIQQAFSQAGLDSLIRAEALTLAQFAGLFRCLENLSPCDAR